MNTRLDEPTVTVDPVVRGLFIVTVAITIIGMLAWSGPPSAAASTT
jgi:hypothetical protein